MTTSPSPKSRHSGHGKDWLNVVSSVCFALQCFVRALLLQHDVLLLVGTYVKEIIIIKGGKTNVIFWFKIYLFI